MAKRNRTKLLFLAGAVALGGFYLFRGKKLKPFAYRDVEVKTGESTSKKEIYVATIDTLTVRAYTKKEIKLLIDVALGDVVPCDPLETPPAGLVCVPDVRSETGYLFDGKE